MRLFKSFYVLPQRVNRRERDGHEQGLRTDNVPKRLISDRTIVIKGESFAMPGGAMAKRCAARFIARFTRCDSPLCCRLIRRRGSAVCARCTSGYKSGLLCR